MEVDRLIAVLEGDDKLMSVVGLLGQDCLTQRRAVKNDQYAATADMIVNLRGMAATESTHMWSVDGERCAGPSPALKERLAKARAPPRWQRSPCWRGSVWPRRAFLRQCFVSRARRARFCSAATGAVAG